MNVIKRNGEKVSFDLNKIITAITKANDKMSLNDKVDTEFISSVANQVKRFLAKDKIKNTFIASWNLTNSINGGN